MASPALRSRQSSVSRSSAASGTGGAYRPDDHGHPPVSPDVYGRQASLYSSARYHSQVSRSGSVKAAALRVAGVFGSCFVPRVQIKTQEEGDDSSVAVAEYFVSTDSAKNIIKQGLSSTMYKGKLKDGSLIAVKCVRKQLYGQYLTDELTTELETLQKIEHLNLVRFLGFFERMDDCLIVVEYVSNGSLREHLDESRGNGLELAQRLNIAIDIANAITYLHENKEQSIIHGAIRSSGVLLTEALTAKVAGFGLAGMVASGSGSGSEATPVKGAAGYVDPEYLRTYQLTDKSDVYSFGVLLVELVTGRPPVERSRGGEPRLTTKWALQKRRGGEAVVAMDPRMRRNPASVATVERMMALAEQCVAPARKDRPSMRRCSELLWSIRRDYHRREQARSAAIAEERDDELVIR
ncbi:hypothetical protein PR202_ga14014 [Eleusine coracana subsp. coracana]|uniref:Protein kinase domain-containing protein n=1 Tax=Eleusine coracana subsp. coracana TaxID=191504 RepID=A0AAV5CGC7_ELECO|nr:hypothetical protein PR202_ga14014 [Eleusine coracana subsp. coracana]